MYIIDQLRENVVNMDNVSNLSLEGRQIVAYDTSGHRNQLGIYDYSRADEVFNIILDDCFPVDETLDHNDMIFYMPEN